jgi:dTDP-4-dehydrorhamnose 3,5-epimerase
VEIAVEYIHGQQKFEQMKIVKCKWNGLYEIHPQTVSDRRGGFTKIFHREILESVGIHFELREEFFSFSVRNVIRGMHFQLPPMQHQKIVHCISGAIVDVLLDLRKGEPSFGKCVSIPLNDVNKTSIVIPPGVAHGFLSLTDNACVVYKTDREYNQRLDSGIRWNSIEFDWPIEDFEPIVSDRDNNHPYFDQFESPFH